MDQKMLKWLMIMILEKHLQQMEMVCGYLTMCTVYSTVQ